MLKISEDPLINLSEGKFGTQVGLETGPDEEPDCELDFGTFNDVGFDDSCVPPNEVQGPADGEIESCDVSTNSPFVTPSTPTITPTETPIASPSNSNCIDSTL